MNNPVLKINENYWDSFAFDQDDLEFLYNHLIEVETPQTPQEILSALVTERIRIEKANLEKKQKNNGDIYLPKEEYTQGQTLVFPVLNWDAGKVISVRDGNNPELPAFQVIEVEFSGGERRCFASSLKEHSLNQASSLQADDPMLDDNWVIKTYGNILIDKMELALQQNQDLVKIAGKWFPRTLLVDVNIGFLNLAEALLEMNGGGPLSTHAILQQIELPTDVNVKLAEFSLNLALQEDERFDEVGPAGEVLWFLHRLEPEFVLQTPIFLRNRPLDHDKELVAPYLKMLDSRVTDELEPRDIQVNNNEITISLIYPYWRAGVLPLSHRLKHFFPTAYETPRVLFSFTDAVTNTEFQGWVDRQSKIVYGLSEWYADQGVIPGSLIHISKGKEPGEVLIKSERKRPGRDWIRTVLVGTDGGIVFAMVKQLISTVVDERMAIFVPDPELLDKVWETNNRRKPALDQVVLTIMQELVKLSTQGHVHAQELYAAVNLVYRCSPGAVLYTLLTSSSLYHLGDLYFRLEEK